MEFEWDPAKEALNRRKHGIGFDAAAEVFRAPDLVEVPDLRGLDDEPRFRAVGTVDGHLLIVAFALRGERIRIISARGATPRERKSHRPI